MRWLTDELDKELEKVNPEKHREIHQRGMGLQQISDRRLKMEKRIDPSDLLKNQITDAQQWAKAFCQSNPSMDEGMMLAWFANAIMTAIDATNNSKPKPRDENEE